MIRAGKNMLSSKLLALVCVASLTVVPWGAAWAQSSAAGQLQGFGQLPATGWQTSKLSLAVVNDANQAVVNLLIAKQSGNLTASVVANAANSLKILFDHLQEIGLNAALQKRIVNNEAAFLDAHPSDSQVSAFQSALEFRGAFFDAT